MESYGGDRIREILVAGNANHNNYLIDIISTLVLRTGNMLEIVLL